VKSTSILKKLFEGEANLFSKKILIRFASQQIKKVKENFRVSYLNSFSKLFIVSTKLHFSLWPLLIFNCPINYQNSKA